MQFFRYNLVYKEKFIYRIRTKVVFWLQEIFEQPCSQVWIACFLNFKSHITRYKLLSSQAMAKQLIRDKRKLPQSFVLSIFSGFSVCSFLNRTSSRRTILSLVFSYLVFAYLTWVVDVTRMCFGEFVETLYSEKRKYGEKKGENNSSRVMDADQSYLK